MKTEVSRSLNLQLHRCLEEESGASHGILSAQKVLELKTAAWTQKELFQDQSGSGLKHSALQRTCLSSADSTPCTVSSWYCLCFRLLGNFLMWRIAAETASELSDSVDPGSRRRRHRLPFFFCSTPTTVRLWPADTAGRCSDGTTNQTKSTRVHTLKALHSSRSQDGICLWSNQEQMKKTPGVFQYRRLLGGQLPSMIIFYAIL